MGVDDAWLRFILAALVTWRVTHLLSFEDGPSDVVARLRRWVGAGFWGRMMDCFDCLSIAAGVTLILKPSGKDWWLVWLGLSGAACLLNRIGHDPVVVQSIDEGEPSHAVLRTESGEGEDSGERSRSAHVG